MADDHYQCVFAPVLIDVLAPDTETARKLAQAELARRASSGELRPSMYELVDQQPKRREVQLCPTI